MKTIVMTLILSALLAGSASAHCQIPCGIYNDAARITEMKEHVTTIEKSMNEITKIPADSPQNNNQFVRWVNNKEAHADKLTEVVTYYFLAQRIKPGTDHYDAQLKTLHGMIVTAMKAKQTVDLEQVKKLRGLIVEFESLYHTH